MWTSILLYMSYDRYLDTLLEKLIQRAQKVQEESCTKLQQLMTASPGIVVYIHIGYIVYMCNHT